MLCHTWQSNASLLQCGVPHDSSPCWVWHVLGFTLTACSAHVHRDAEHAQVRPRVQPHFARNKGRLTQLRCSLRRVTTWPLKGGIPSRVQRGGQLDCQRESCAPTNRPMKSASVRANMWIASSAGRSRASGSRNAALSVAGAARAVTASWIARNWRSAAWQIAVWLPPAACACRHQLGAISCCKHPKRAIRNARYKRSRRHSGPPRPVCAM